MSSIRYVDWPEYDESRKIKKPVAFIAMRSEIPNLEIYYPDGSSKEVEFTLVTADVHHITEEDLHILIEDAKYAFPVGRIYIERPLIKMTPEEQWWEVYDYLEDRYDFFDVIREREREEHDRIHYDELTEEEQERYSDSLYEECLEDEVEAFLKDLLGKAWKGRKNR